MYEICNVICGFKLPDEIRYLIYEISVDHRNLGLDGEYSGIEPNPIYCGVKIFNFNACDQLTLEELIVKSTPTPEQLLEASERIVKTRLLFSNFCDDPENQISKEEKEQFLNLMPEKPDTFLMWSTS